jgi:hypothetical protein
VKRIDVVGKSREEIDALLAKTPRETLLQIIYRLATLEPHFSVREFAALRRLRRDTVLALIRDKKIKPIHTPTDRGDYRIPLSAVRDFDQRTAIS